MHSPTISPLSSQSVLLAELPSFDDFIFSNMACKEVHEVLLQNPALPGLIILDADNPASCTI
jgi:hypothetical protein